MTTEINLLTFVSPTVHTHVGAPVQPHPGVEHSQQLVVLLLLQHSLTLVKELHQ